MKLWQKTTLTLAVGLAMTACDNQTVTTIDTAELLKNLDNPEYVIIDSRHDSLYNGFKSPNAIRGGHIMGAIQFSTTWLDNISADRFEAFAADKGISKDKTLVFYDDNLDDLERISAEFAAKGYKVRVFNEFINYANVESNPLQIFPNYAWSVSPQWLNAVMNGEKAESFNNDPSNLMVFEVSWGPLEKANSYAQHIAGAYHFDTDWVENAPVWNLSDPALIEQNLIKNGIDKDKTVVLYSDNQLAALRIFWALKWAGVQDVRYLNGGLYMWKDLGYPTETKVNIPQPVAAFGATIPQNPQYTISMPQQAIDEMKKYQLKLVSIRSWDEYTGKVSGYDYIPGKGEPQGAIWGFAGTDSSNVADYYDPDGTLRNPYEIFNLWQGQGIRRGDHLAFYCGTGWRAGVPWFITQLTGWTNTVIYDGGWNAWQMDSVFPVQKGAPNNISKPNPKNDFGKLHKAGASCKS
ncbi:rhodanese-like domain-containing protein [Testudinibacter aquarius]|uniref:Sulfurtransferase n=1 Tax=Testudinibacter aquarius TaxID=1524974 RepID=A0A4R3YA82_9PAST|nr:rhodanese-like domain-containing protein [Testudinibacter aquarius]KAE9528316.1 thiosulfate sulfurtransferase [Testudinibacter aquarius]TCV88846.1 thiosulfate/3-mercaptopyruvate sulfurtransferase [Testudinibacter aquarius]TNG93414.1 sulfurtransferase [Testudinibacter aquarius]